MFCARPCGCPKTTFEYPFCKQPRKKKAAKTGVGANLTGPANTKPPQPPNDKYSPKIQALLHMGYLLLGVAGV